MDLESDASHHARWPKLTGYRLLVVLFTASFGTWKAYLSYRGYSTAPNTLDWLSGVVIFLTLYWMGIYERHGMHNMPWLFDEDLVALAHSRLYPHRSGASRLERVD
ncbi:hypothetical protein CVT24_006301 [Panaeolus cyanescens]|uniref:Uncharacterized protein n=1 Tax=Panaeolus cyanescens TaxID=181874 RepID=A0A409V8L0_9AGAR|nr:hypothetical protein CVT24_006301 [Panaeolus cyanescens]